MHVGGFRGPISSPIVKLIPTLGANASPVSVELAPAPSQGERTAFKALGYWTETASEPLDGFFDVEAATQPLGV